MLLTDLTALFILMEQQVIMLLPLIHLFDFSCSTGGGKFLVYESKN